MSAPRRSPTSRLLAPLALVLLAGAGAWLLLSPAPPPPPPAATPSPPPPPGSPQELLAQLAALDAPHAARVRVRARPGAEGPPLLELEDEAGLHPSYEATAELCKLSEPWDRDDAEFPLEAQRAWLATMAEAAPLQRAMALVPGGDLEDVRRVWFGAGRGFEHVFCGEAGGPRGAEHLGGYHWWDRHRRLAHRQRARFLGVRGPASATSRESVLGQFEVDFDGGGPRPPLRKKTLGGFSVGHSPAPLVVLGYLVVRLELTPPVMANLTGTPRPWMVYSDKGTLRTLWPKG